MRMGVSMGCGHPRGSGDYSRHAASMRLLRQVTVVVVCSASRSLPGEERPTRDSVRHCGVQCGRMRCAGEDSDRSLGLVDV